MALYGSSTITTQLPSSFASPSAQTTIPSSFPIRAGSQIQAGGGETTKTAEHDVNGSVTTKVIPRFWSSGEHKDLVPNALAFVDNHPKFQKEPLRPVVMTISSVNKRLKDGWLDWHRHGPAEFAKTAMGAKIGAGNLNLLTDEALLSNSDIFPSSAFYGNDDDINGRLDLRGLFTGFGNAQDTRFTSTPAFDELLSLNTVAGVMNRFAFLGVVSGSQTQVQSGADEFSIAIITNKFVSVFDYWGGRNNVMQQAVLGFVVSRVSGTTDASGKYHEHGPLQITPWSSAKNHDQNPVQSLPLTSTITGKFSHAGYIPAGQVVEPPNSNISPATSTKMYSHDLDAARAAIGTAAHGFHQFFINVHSQREMFAY